MKIKKIGIIILLITLAGIFTVIASAEEMNCSVKVTENTLKVTDYNLMGSISVNISSDKTISAELYLGIFDDTSNVVTAVSKAVSLNTGTNSVTFSDIDFSGINSEYYTYKVFLWDKQTQQPLAETVSGDIDMECYGYVLDTAVDEDNFSNLSLGIRLCTGKGDDIVQYYETFDIMQDNGEYISYDVTDYEVAEEVINLLENNRTIVFSISDGQLKNIRLPDAEEGGLTLSKSGDFEFDADTMTFGEDMVDNNTTVVFVDTKAAYGYLAEPRRVSELVDGDTYKSSYIYYNKSVTDKVSLIVIYDADNIPEHIDVPKKEPAYRITDDYGYILDTAVDEDWFENTILQVKMMTKDGIKIVDCYETLDIIQANGECIRYDTTDNDLAHKVEDLLNNNRTIQYSLYNDQLKLVKLPGAEERFAVIHSGSFEYDKSNLKIGTDTLDSDTLIYFINTEDIDLSMAGGIEDLIDGSTYNCSVYYESRKSQVIPFMLVFDAENAPTPPPPEPVIINIYAYILDTAVEEDNFGNGRLQIKMLTDKYGVVIVNADESLDIMQEDGTYKTYDITDYEGAYGVQKELMENRVLSCKVYDNELKIVKIPDTDAGGFTLKNSGAFKYDESTSKLGTDSVDENTVIFSINTGSNSTVDDISSLLDNDISYNCDIYYDSSDSQTASLVVIYDRKDILYAD